MGMYSVLGAKRNFFSVIGNFNHWKKREYELYPRWDKAVSGEGFIPGFKLGEAYKYHIVGYHGRETDKGDPFANFWEEDHKQPRLPGYVL